jgi:hypothetical protein
VTKKGVRSVLPVPMVGTLLVFCGIDHALASSYNARGDLASHQGQLSPDLLAPITQNPYQYCGNNPVTYVDSDGHAFMLVTAVVGALVGGAAGAIREI